MYSQKLLDLIFDFFLENKLVVDDYQTVDYSPTMMMAIASFNNGEAVVTLTSDGKWGDVLVQFVGGVYKGAKLIKPSVQELSAAYEAAAERGLTEG